MADVIVIGAAGTIGKSIVRDLVESGVDVIASDMDEDRLHKVKNWTGGNLQTLKLNIKDSEQIIKALKQAKVCVNAANYTFNTEVMKACASAGVHVIDLGGLYTKTKEQLKLNSMMEDAGVLSVVGMGSDPGASNVFSRYGVENLDEAEEIHIRFGSSTSGLTFAFAIDTIIDEAIKNAVVYRDGKIQEIEPLAEEEYTTFHEDIGVQKTYSIIHSELVTLPESYPFIQEITYKDSWDEETIKKIKMLDELGLLNETFLNEKGSPRKQLVSLLRQTLNDETPEWGKDELMVEVRGKKGGKSSSIKIEMLAGWQEKWEMGPTSYATAVPASIVAQMILKGELTATGVKPPEQCVDPNKFLTYLAEKNVELYVTHDERKELKSVVITNT